MSQAELFQNLLIMAAIDGRLSESELRLLSDRAAQWGITDDEFERAIQNAIAGCNVLAIPQDQVERAQMLKDMIRMMAADGQLPDSQKRLFATATTALGITPIELNQLIDTVLEEGV